MASSDQTILVTGGVGFIGTHTVVQLLKSGFKVSIIDNLDNSVIEAVDRVREVVGPELSERLEFTKGDLRNKDDLENLFSKTKFDAVIHFTGLKAVGESVANPRRYFDLLLEEIARDIQKAEPEWRIILLRYFNPVGAHESGKLGEDPRGIPNQLMPYIQQVAVGRLPELNVYSLDYPTKDGSAVRDYIHIMDLADGHIAAVRKLLTTENIGCTAYNLGTGQGTSVLEMVAAFEKVSGKKIPLKLSPRRPGDATAVYASTEKAEKELGWKFDAVIHFAGLKAVGESVANPHRYFDVNLIGTINLYEVMAKYNCKKMVFSSSTTLYGQPEKMPCVEDFELRAISPYGRTKLLLEEIARDIQKAEPEWRIILLRYFNPVGAHESGKLGEDPRGIPNQLMPYIQQVAVGRLPELNVYGLDYPTKDGSAVRDYIHIMDLADGHIAAVRKLLTTENIGCTAYNLGTGQGTSVLEMVAAFEKVSGKKIPLKLSPRRPGDATAVYASTEKAEKELVGTWKAKYGVEEMCRDQWNWARNNPWGNQGKED